MLKEQLPPTTEDAQPQSGDSKRGDRILAWCFLASILINLGFGLWLNFADIYGEKRQAETNKIMHVKIYRAPIKQKPKPKPKIPPKPPKVVHVVHVRPRPTPPPPRPAQHFTVGHHSTSTRAVAVEAPPPPVVEAPVQPVQPEATTVEKAPPAPPPTPEPPYHAPPAPPAPVYHAPPAPPKPVYHAPPAPPARPRNYLPGVETRLATLDDSSIKSPDTSAMDTGSITGPCVLTFEVSENGRISHVRIQKSSGNHDFDSACVDVVQGGRGTPAVQDHIPYSAPGVYTFSM